MEGLRVRVERVEERIERVEARADTHHSDLAVIKTQIGGVLRLLWIILTAVMAVLVTFLAKGKV